MKALVLDGYTDEPACLGVPPFISPHVRLAFGALKDARAEVEYATIDQWREGRVDLLRHNLLVVVRNVAVPGKYLRGMPASDRELLRIAEGFRGTKVASLGARPETLSSELRESFDHLSTMDLDAGVHDLALHGDFTERRRNHDEWRRWSVRGAEACACHPDIWGPLIAEVQMYRGCVRYVSGGCSFCIEPLLGGVVHREPADILAETQALAAAGVRNIRLGAQSCIYCYMSKETGRTETPLPDHERIERLLRGIKETVRPEVFHLDNANPAVIAAHPEECRKITKAIAEHCTSGNVLAFGLETADPRVARANNLNATPEDTLIAIRLINDIGSSRGNSGLPLVLPGLNFVCGLVGETKETYRLNLEFLMKVLEEGLLLRRTNIRQVIPSRKEFPGVRDKERFVRFKREVREKVDLPMLEKTIPDRTVLRGVYTELREGGRTFGRQAGTYPILVGLPYPYDVGKKVDVAVTGRGFRSVTGVIHPTDPQTATLGMLEAIPGIGRRRAMSIIRSRPFATPQSLWDMIGEPKAIESAQFHLAWQKTEQH